MFTLYFDGKNSLCLKRHWCFPCWICGSGLFSAQIGPLCVEISY